MPRPKTGRTLLTVRLDPIDLTWLEQAAAQRGIGRAEALRRLVTASRQAAEYAAAETAKQPKPRARLAPHPHKPQPGNALRCAECGGRRSDHDE